MDNQKVVHPHNGMLVSFKKEEKSDTHYNVDEPWRRYAERNNAVTEGRRVDYLTSVSSSWRQKVEPWLPTEVGWGLSVHWRQTFNFTRRRALWMGGGDGCTMMWSANATELCTSKWLRWQILSYVYSTTTKILSFSISKSQHILLDFFDYLYIFTFRN